MAQPPPEDEWWEPGRFGDRLPRLRARAALTDTVRGFFQNHDFDEVETPALQLSPGLEPHLTAFVTELDAAGGQGGTRYLHTSPEYAMKKLLVAGMARIFQLARVWRNEQRSATHHPEFTMLEWYRAGAGWREVAADAEALLRAVAQAVPDGDGLYRRAAAESDPAQPWQFLSVADAFGNHAGIDLLATMPEPANPDRGLLAAEAARIGIRAESGDSWDDVFFRIFLDRVEPKLGIGVPTVLFDYPISMAALARPSPDDPRVAERFEIFVCGMELANGFGELTDAKEQRRRFEADIALKRSLGRDLYPIDEDFLAALAHGMPQSSGIALGFDRLVMLATGTADIEDVLWVPMANNK